MMQGEPDFIAEVRFKTTEEGGRHSPVFSGYWGLIKFPFTKFQSGGKHTFHNTDMANLGETLTASIKLLVPEHFEKGLEEGMEFEIMDGTKSCGTGKLIKILNPDLIKY